LITIPLLPFGVIGQLKFLSEKAIGTMFNLAIKIFVVAFISTLSVNILTGLVDNARETATSSDFIGNISYFLQVLLYALILFYMTKKIPELVSGLLSGNPSLSGGSMKEMAMSVARGAANAVSRGGGFAGAVAGGMKALSEAAGPMPQYGGKGNFGVSSQSSRNIFFRINFNVIFGAGYLIKHCKSSFLIFTKCSVCGIDNINGLTVFSRFTN